MIRIYRQLLTANFQQSVQYRIQFVLWMLFSVIRPTIFLAAWVAVAAAQGGSVSGYTAGDFAGYYIALTLVSHLTAAWNSFEFEYEVRQGRLSPKLLRPLHPLHYAAVESWVFKLSTLPPLAVVLLLLALTFNVHFQTEWWQLALFVPSIVLAWMLNFMIGWIAATSVFWLQRIQTVNTLLQRTSFIFAGQIAPLALMPLPLQIVSYALPFAYVLAIPSEILRGGVPLDRALLYLVGQVVWLGIAWILFQVAWRAGLREYSAVGA
ncbi:MAG TPA: ABC-2 family transporter protein [Candidatus Limnocylindria bacterium]|nr:ABC-2 family transporter protein [Candidatus Limnocylindria bacterium]